MKQFLFKWWWIILIVIFVAFILSAIGYGNVEDIKRDAKDVSNIENFEIISYEGSSWGLITGGSCSYTVKKKERPNELFLIEIEKQLGDYTVYWKSRVDQPQKSE